MPAAGTSGSRWGWPLERSLGKSQHSNDSLRLGLVLVEPSPPWGRRDPGPLSTTDKARAPEAQGPGLHQLSEGGGGSGLGEKGPETRGADFGEAWSPLSPLSCSWFLHRLVSRGSS